MLRLIGWWKSVLSWLFRASPAILIDFGEYSIDVNILFWVESTQYLKRVIGLSFRNKETVFTRVFKVVLELIVIIIKLF